MHFCDKFELLVKSKMADGGWRMADGGWRMADGGCRPSWRSFWIMTRTPSSALTHSRTDHRLPVRSKIFPIKCNTART